MATLVIEVSDEAKAALEAAGAHEDLVADGVVLEQAIRWTVQATAEEIADLAQAAGALNSRGIAILADRITAMTRAVLTNKEGVR